MPALWTDAALALVERVRHHYEPPRDKPYLVFLQCSIRRPFSRSPSHGSMRRAIALATGFDPARQPDGCPVHVVVLASTIGPVPYELENVSPANIRATGVKQMSPQQYDAARPVLARRMADYLVRHGAHYQRIAAFADGRYGEVLSDAARLAERPITIVPDETGASVVSLAGSRPRKYWERYWIQLFLEVAGWLPMQDRWEAEQRLKQADVVYREPRGGR